MHPIVAATLIAATPAATPSAATPGALKTFGDWAVGCDNVHRCTIASLALETAAGPGYTARITRAAGPAGGFELAFDNKGDGPAPAALRVGAARYALAGDALVGRRAQQIVAALAIARVATLIGRDGKPLGTLSLAGLSAALRYADAVQHRVDTVTAAVAKGRAPASAVPAAPPVPVVHAPALTGAPARLSKTQITAMNRTARCDAPPSADVDWSPVVSPVGGGTSLAVVPCSAGAYNVIGALFVIRGTRVDPAQTDAPAGFEASGADHETRVPSVVNGSVEKGILNSYAKGRGLGDCGVSQRFAWDGTRLRLIAQAEMSECRGNPNLITTWTARVERP
ncbi:DUF1176 domain-containing protein [Sphingomonas sp. RHCKR47]|uniref:DUF1176 domain-containing protein n=1 Tax=Sphingomonas citricola TaxID=2862498 RepID=UPI001C680C9A|nr:DUF1176 domain-containing protein [Sphingomonas citricola]MBW6524920.1 DUF1176 domain-containing protein [Sphingomonas citricola]